MSQQCRNTSRRGPGERQGVGHWRAPELYQRMTHLVPLKLGHIKATSLDFATHAERGQGTSILKFGKHAHRTLQNKQLLYACKYLVVTLQSKVMDLCIASEWALGKWISEYTDKLMNESPGRGQWWKTNSLHSIQKRPRSSHVVDSWVLWIMYT